MTTDKELLLKDLCARIPYKIKAQIPDEYGGYVSAIESVDIGGFIKDFEGTQIEIEYIKPYLFPMSSMTEEQYEQFIIVSGWDGDFEDIKRGKFSCIGYIGLDYLYDSIDWLNKNNFDYRGLIEKGLAIDATGLNVY